MSTDDGWKPAVDTPAWFTQPEAEGAAGAEQGPVGPPVTDRAEPAAAPAETGGVGSLGDLFAGGPSAASVPQTAPRQDDAATGDPVRLSLGQPVATRPLSEGLPQKIGSPTWTPKNVRRYRDGERLWPMVDAVLAVVGSTASLQQLVARLELTREPEQDRRQHDTLMQQLMPKLGQSGVIIADPNDVPLVLDMAYDELIGVSVLGELWRDASITEIMVDGWDQITIESHGKLLKTPITFRNSDHANAVARSLALRVSDRAVSRSIPLVTAELPGARITFAYGSVVKSGLSITLRKFRDLLGLEDLRRLGALSDEMAAFLRDAVVARAGILVSGGTGTGKTTIVNLLSSFIPDTERVVTIEDAFELQLSNTHVVSLQTKEAASSDDQVSVKLGDLLRNTLRMRPDRIIVGEIREAEGAVVMLAAANTGHDGTMTTIHATTADLAVNERLVDLVRQDRNSTEEAVRRTIASAFELVVQVSRGKKGIRYISEIALCDRTCVRDGIIDLVPIFVGEDRGDGTAVFREVNKVPSGSGLGVKLSDIGALGRWS